MAPIRGIEPRLSQFNRLPRAPCSPDGKKVVDQPGNAPGFPCLQGTDAAFCLALSGALVWNRTSMARFSVACIHQICFKGLIARALFDRLYCHLSHGWTGTLRGLRTMRRAHVPSAQLGANGGNQTRVGALATLCSIIELRPHIWWVIGESNPAGVVLQTRPLPEPHP